MTACRLQQFTQRTQRSICADVSSPPAHRERSEHRAAVRQHVGNPRAKRQAAGVAELAQFRQTFVFRDILGMAGYTVSTAETVEQAIDAIDGQTEENHFDILVTDAVLPDGEPSRAIKQFRGKGWKPVLVCSGYIDSDELVKDLGRSNYEFLQKPFSNAQLLSKVQALLLKEATAPAQTAARSGSSQQDPSPSSH